TTPCQPRNARKPSRSTGRHASIAINRRCFASSSMSIGWKRLRCRKRAASRRNCWRSPADNRRASGQPASASRQSVSSMAGGGRRQGSQVNPLMRVFAGDACRITWGRGFTKARESPQHSAALLALWLTPAGAPCVEPVVLQICSEACTPADRDTYVLRAHSCSCTRRLRNPPSLVTVLLKFTSSLHGVDDQTVREVYSPRTAHKRAWL